jgi:uncharacterized protein YihD (DUF1040 family)
MRDSKRIKEIVNRLANAWLQNPDLRLGQLIVNALPDNFGNDPFYIKDDELIREIENLSYASSSEAARREEAHQKIEGGGGGMRAYFLCNQYLSSIQCGIQSAHVVAEMFVKYNRGEHCDIGKVLFEWATKHKTMILLNGGYQEDLKKFYTFLESPENVFPYDFFQEESASLNEAWTSVGIILPEKVYKSIAEVRERRTGWTGAYFGQLSYWEQELVVRLSKFGLAH